MQITREMVMELNNELSVMGCPFRYKYIEERTNPCIEISLPNMNYVKSCIINITKEFFEWINLWFKVKGIELSCNNTGSTFWSKSGWEK